MTDIDRMADAFIEQKQKNRFLLELAAVCLMAVLGAIALQGWALHRQLDNVTRVMCQELLIGHRNANETAHAAIVHNEHREWRHLGIPTTHFEFYEREDVVPNSGVCGGSRVTPSP